MYERVNVEEYDPADGEIDLNHGDEWFSYPGKGAYDHTFREFTVENR